MIWCCIKADPGLPGAGPSSGALSAEISDVFHRTDFVQNFRQVFNAFGQTGRENAAILGRESVPWTLRQTQTNKRGDPLWLIPLNVLQSIGTPFLFFVFWRNIRELVGRYPQPYNTSRRSLAATAPFHLRICHLIWPHLHLCKLEAIFW